MDTTTTKEIKDKLDVLGLEGHELVGIFSNPADGKTSIILKKPCGYLEL